MAKALAKVQEKCKDCEHYVFGDTNKDYVCIKRAPSIDGQGEACWPKVKGDWKACGDFEKK